MVQWWKDLSVAKKLYAVVGVMALLIATELFTLLFAMDVLSSVRSFVGGEGNWSKAQKNAVHNLHRYSVTQDPVFWQRFEANLSISKGDHDARVELEKPNFDLATVERGFIQGEIHRDDGPGLIKLIRRFYWVSYIAKALSIWREADAYILKIADQGSHLRQVILRNPDDRREIEATMRRIDTLNEDLTNLEVHFSDVLGEGSRWLERVLMIALICAVLTVESTGLFLTITFSRSLSANLRRLMNTAREVGRGNFSVQAPVESRDELGQLAEAINKMSSDLARSTGERAHAEEASQSKSMFLANMSHEIRTPLGIIMGLTEVLKDDELRAEDRTRFVETIERTGKNLSRIINDILDLSKVEAGHLEIEKTVFALPEFLDEMQSMLNVQADKTENTLKFETNLAMPDLVFTDRTRLRQILVNLVNNALKFTRHGLVTVTSKTSGGFLTFDVKDNGSGIAPESQEVLFQEFAQAPQAGASAQEGTGLGLVLSQRLARALGGELSLAQSELGVGSIFRLKLPLEMPLAAHTESRKVTAAGSAENLQGRCVLVVEDSEDNRALVRLLLFRRGVRVTFAENGEQGVAAAMQPEVDAVLMDMQMPIMDGYRATRELRERGFTKPIIALTAHAMKEDRDRCLAAGCDDYLTKPINSNLLYDSLAKRIAAHLRTQAAPPEISV